MQTPSHRSTGSVLRAEQRAALLSETIRVLQLESDHLREHRGVPLQLAINAALYILLLERDFLAIDRMNAVETPQSHRSLLARTAAMLVYECMEDVPRLFGGELRRGCRDAELSDAAILSLNASMSAFNKFKNEKRGELKTLRNYAMAHRDKDAAEQLRVMDSIDIGELLSITAELRSLLDHLSGWLIGAISHLRTPNAVAAAHFARLRRK